jgi:ABC-type branched-subunit amino acid transport system ATPase component
VTLRLAVGAVTALLGPARARQWVMTELDESTGRRAEDQESVGVVRVTAAAADSMAQRRAALAAARQARPSIVLVDRITDGLPATDRRTLLGELRELTTEGCAVLVDDTDPVAALAVAGAAVRVDSVGALVDVPLSGPDQLAS